MPMPCLSCGRLAQLQTQHEIIMILTQKTCCNGQIVGQPRKRECRQNVRKMSKNCPEGLKNTVLLGHFLTIFAYLVDAFVC